MTSTTSALERAPLGCPFCGGDRLIRAFTRATDTFSYFSVECTDCGVEVADDESQEAADAAWNRRAPDLALARRAEAAEKRVSELEAGIGRLEAAGTQVSRLGAKTGPQWIKLNAALAHARALLTPIAEGR